MLFNRNVSLLCRHNTVNIRKFSSSRTVMGTKLSWSELRRKKWGPDYCLENFDEFYKPVFGNSWPSIRLALLSQQKYCAFINNFANVEEAESLMKKIGAKDIRHEYNRRLLYLLRTMKEKFPGDLSQEIENIPQSVDDINVATEEEIISEEFEDNENRFASQAMHKTASFNEFVPVTKLKGLEDYIDESDFLCQENIGGKMNFDIIKENPIILPKAWKIYAYKPGDIRTYPSPKVTNANVLGYYLMDMASVLPVLALNPKPGDTILDMCAAPGGKSLAIMQTLHDVKLTSNDGELSRIKKLVNVIETFVPSSETKPKLMVSDGRKFVEQCGMFNKILVDAPCTTDRLSANREDNNIFKPARMAERIRLPQLQTELLSTALQAVKRGGSVVYSTCAMSPVQNDGVVHMALRKLWEESSSNFVIHDLTYLFYPLRSMLFFHQSPKYGHLVSPNVLKNFGPTYICKISKT